MNPIGGNDYLFIMTKIRIQMKDFPIKIICSLISITLGCMLISCSQKQTVVEETYNDGSPKRECVYIGQGKDRVLVKETFFYPSRQVEVTGEYKDGERHGYWIYYFENGNVWSEGFYNMGKNDGKRLTYFENGKLRYEAHYKDDERVGTWKFYDEAGNLIKDVNY